MTSSRQANNSLGVMKFDICTPFYESGYTADGPKSVKDLESQYYNEIYQNRPVVTYCGSGVTACNALLTMSEVGLESALYVGSSSDWVTYDGFPLKTGVETLR